MATARFYGGLNAGNCFGPSSALILQFWASLEEIGLVQAHIKPATWCYFQTIYIYTLDFMSATLRIEIIAESLLQLLFCQQ